MGRVKVVPYAPAMAGELASLYNSVTGGVPHCYPVSIEDFAAALAPAAEGGGSHERLRSEAAFVARDGASTLGFVHVATERPEKRTEAEQGAIRFLAYERGHRGAGQLLLESAEEYCRQRRLTRVTAFLCEFRYPFYYLRPILLSDRLDHVRALLQFNDYEQFKGEVVLDWPNYDPAEPAAADVPAEIAVQWEDGRGDRPNVSVKAYRDGRQVGSCYCICGGESSRSAQAQDWAFVLELWVVEPLQGRGLGRHLLQRALKEMHRKGYRHAAISTDWRNYRAFLFYSNYGFHVVDWTYAFRRDLE